MKKIRNFLVQLRYFVPDLIRELKYFPHSVLVLITTALAMAWSTDSVLNNLPLSTNFGGSFLLIFFGYISAIALHFSTYNDVNVRMYKTFRQYPGALWMSIKGWLVIQGISLIVVLVIAFVIAVIFFEFDNIEKSVDVFINAISVLIWPALCVGVLFWGEIAADEADHAAANYANGVSMEDW